MTSPLSPPQPPRRRTLVSSERPVSSSLLPTFCVRFQNPHTTHKILSPPSPSPGQLLGATQFCRRSYGAASRGRRSELRSHNHIGCIVGCGHRIQQQEQEQQWPHRELVADWVLHAPNVFVAGATHLGVKGSHQRSTGVCGGVREREEGRREARSEGGSEGQCVRGARQRRGR